jgi:hypothetical protein
LRIRIWRAVTEQERNRKNCDKVFGRHSGQRLVGVCVEFVKPRVVRAV